MHYDPSGYKGTSVPFDMGDFNYSDINSIDYNAFLKSYVGEPPIDILVRRKVMNQREFIETMKKAIDNHNIEEVTRLVKNDSNKLNTILPTGSWLHLAVLNNDEQLVKTLLDMKIDTDIVAASNKGNALTVAARVGNNRMINLLLERGVNLNCECSDANPLLGAIDNGRIDAIKLLLEKEKENISVEKFNILHEYCKKRAIIMSNSQVLDIFSQAKRISRENKMDYEKFSLILKKEIKNSILKLIEYTNDDTLYIISLNAETDLKRIRILFNTEKNYQQKIDGESK